MVFAARTGPLGSSVHFGSFHQARTAAYAPDTPYWSQRRLRPAIWVDGQTPSGQKGVPRAAPNPKMTSISAMPPDCSDTGRAHGAEYSIFCTAQAGVHQDRKEHLNFLCNLQLEVCKTLRESIADVQIERRAAAPPPCAQIQQRGDAPNEPPSANKRSSSAIPE